MARSSVRACRTVQPAERRRCSGVSILAAHRCVAQAGGLDADGERPVLEGVEMRHRKDCPVLEPQARNVAQRARLAGGRGQTPAQPATRGPLTSRRSVMGSSSREQACGLNRFSFCDARSRAGTLVGCSGMDLPGHVSGLLRGGLTCLLCVGCGVVVDGGGRRWLLGGRCPRSSDVQGSSIADGSVVVGATVVAGSTVVTGASVVDGESVVDVGSVVFGTYGGGAG